MPQAPRRAPLRSIARSRAGGATGAAGMTLIEVLMSIAILITGLVAVFALLNGAMSAHKRAVNETEAALVAESALAEIRAAFARGEEPRSDSRGVFVPSAEISGYDVNRQIVSLEPPRRGSTPGLSNLEFFVKVEVRWSQRGDYKTVAVQSVMFRNPSARKR